MLFLKVIKKLLPIAKELIPLVQSSNSASELKYAAEKRIKQRRDRQEKT